MPQPVFGKQKGYIVLISVLLVSAIGAAISIAVILLGLGSSRSSFAVQQSRQAASAANACVEEALQQIRENSNFSGNDTLTVGQGSCSYAVASLGGQSRYIAASGTAGTIVRKSRVNIDAITPIINVVSWEEVADF
ncbi:MAG: hypothetical protein A3C85_03730 [Candidatus Doudnabacteria bacterium RIFCSPHIGHO2_02_FULL_48_21]|uniref:Type 4 fimbrial biogenesis protein PilX N-terminal domain-containing protein n=1 Tax=Candidatus Doudnabacteria bacterium RIFCSPLOWO2_02_FULL_48_13 TaxID=1817845 RepID=A0A1F5QD47_9BACT|nr:MAG: hypothetical protein A3K05_03225 [Candidatus Doudnabacteria bacterium RIFCSPHIGHO2_01_48_18]OGE79619.1 MAG: hypothetical protein A2668_01345 [Candidatus Doudnabacteria bacterium RIFCSPHIGHO2_01_FULL_48_180]OGE91754.1 MAG: hypothetical protein A3F44_00070 [Candidatus Doudnabacteria bacterium RIFCSPHIGHO2_12_FULL_47_25]OGE93567.1 MAG: hypothetical protein A3C85_03730 [Candidatus Doudnabacteria bacterium RIFCSPHIGHO2_02_FULL_48_21]OGE96332.1 MAG: hypothetical protein A3A83_00185 [Candidatu